MVAVASSGEGNVTTLGLRFYLQDMNALRSCLFTLKSSVPWLTKIENSLVGIVRFGGQEHISGRRRGKGGEGGRVVQS